MRLPKPTGRPLQRSGRRRSPRRLGLTSSSCAVFTAETAKIRAWAVPGAADVRFVPNWTEQADPGGVNWTKRKASPMVRSASSLHPSLL